MFTGLVQAIGRVESSRRRGDLLDLAIESEAIAPELELGGSVAIAGVCLTAVELSAHGFRVEVASETLRRTRLGSLSPGEPLNLELPLRASDRLGGHLVQGHVDELGRVASFGPREGNQLLRVEHSIEASRFVVEKGSIAIDGVSLTVTAAGSGWLEVMLIPHTLAVTTLSRLSPGDRVHLEYDILAKYVARLAQPYGSAS
ncbi:MAG TPA: riboflavin synthase [Vicinamibacteria bacterium]|jgi:riboflavin synthase